MKVVVQLILGCFVIFYSCKPDLSNPKVEKLYAEFMEIHDEVMPEISTIHKLKKKLKKIETTDAQREQLIVDLDNADESMMQWMSDFGAFRKMDDASELEKITYLANEKIKISTVSDLMKRSIQAGNEYLKKSNTVK